MNNRLILKSDYPICALVGRSSNFRKYGVPSSGAFDCESALLANSLAGNAVSTPLLEICNGEVEISIESEAFEPWIAVTGGCENRRLRVRSGRSGSIRLAPTLGARMYIAVPGGFHLHGLSVHPVSYAFPAGTHSLEYRSYLPWASLSVAERPSSLQRDVLRVLIGEFWPSDASSLELTVGSSFNRQGVRCSSTLPKHQMEITSRPLPPMAIQWTPSGEVIFIGPDGPPTGGYPLLGSVITADASKIGQLRLGDRVKLLPIHLEEALEEANLRTTRSQNLASLLQSILRS